MLILRCASRIMTALKAVLWLSLLQASWLHYVAAAGSAHDWWPFTSTQDTDVVTDVKRSTMISTPSEQSFILFSNSSVPIKYRLDFTFENGILLTFHDRVLLSQNSGCHNYVILDKPDEPFKQDMCKVTDVNPKYVFRDKKDGDLLLFIYFSNVPLMEVSSFVVFNISFAEVVAQDLCSEAVNLSGRQSTLLKTPSFPQGHGHGCRTLLTAQEETSLHLMDAVAFESHNSDCLCSGGAADGPVLCLGWKDSITFTGAVNITCGAYPALLRADPVRKMRRSSNSWRQPSHWNSTAELAGRLQCCQKTFKLPAELSSIARECRGTLPPNCTIHIESSSPGDEHAVTIDSVGYVTQPGPKDSAGCRYLRRSDAGYPSSDVAKNSTHCFKGNVTFTTDNFDDVHYVCRMKSINVQKGSCDQRSTTISSENITIGEHDTASSSPTGLYIQEHTDTSTLSGEQIAGIAVGCVIAVIIAVVVAVALICDRRRRSRRKCPSTQQTQEEKSQMIPPAKAL